jgi:hypothetical protein
MSDDQGNSNRPTPRKRPRVLDASGFLLWDDPESVNITVNELHLAAANAAPFARARRIQATFAGAEAGGMSEATRLRVLADWAMVVGKYAREPALGAAIELAVVASEQGPSPAAWRTFEALESERVARADDSPAGEATSVLHDALHLFIDGGLPQPPAPPGHPTSLGETAWRYAVNMLAAVAEAAGDDALAALVECDAAMSRRIFTWHAERPALSVAG